MASTIGDRLTQARRRAFVGRAAELARFDALLAPDCPIAVLVVHGPPGIGTSTLTRRFIEVAAERGHPTSLVDLSGGAPLEALTAAQLPTVVPAAPAAGRAGTTRTNTRRPVLALDGVDLEGPVGQALRERVIPALPAYTLVVVASPVPPGATWSADPGWSELVATMRLAAFSAQEAHEYLAARDVPERERDKAVAFTHGHPLALALVAEVIRSTFSFSDRAARDAVVVLVDQLMSAAPTARHRSALAAAAVARTLTQDLLAAMMDTDDALAEFDWLAALPMVDRAPVGLRLHDVTRRLVTDDLQWRAPERRGDLTARARTHLLSRVDGTDSVRAADALAELMYLHPRLRAALSFDQGLAALAVDRATVADAPTIITLIGRHEGEESAALASLWLSARPEQWFVVRAADGSVRGCWLHLRIDDLDPAVAALDPGVQAALSELTRHPRLRPGERATMVRFWCAVDDHQLPSPEQTLMTAWSARRDLTTAGLALSMTSFADPALWGATAEYADLHRFPDADFVVGGRSYGVFGHDWRVVTPREWLARLAAREAAGAAGSAEAENAAWTHPADGGPASAVLDRDEFTRAVRGALRALARPERLRTSPLLGTQLVRMRAGPSAPIGARVTALRSMLVAAAETLRSDERHYRVIHRAYLAPAASLEAAAEALGLPSSTFRRHLGTAVDRVAEVLWAQELDGRDALDGRHRTRGDDDA